MAQQSLCVFGIDQLEPNRPTDALPMHIPLCREEVFNSIWEGLAQGNNVLILDAHCCQLPEDPAR